MAHLPPRRLRGRLTGIATLAFHTHVFRVEYGAAALIATATPGVADPGDQWKKRWEIRADCDKKLHEAKSRRDFCQNAECNRELARLDQEQSRETAKAWREAEKKWRGRCRDDDGPCQDRDH